MFILNNVSLSKYFYFINVVRNLLINNYSFTPKRCFVYVIAIVKKKILKRTRKKE